MPTDKARNQFEQGLNFFHKEDYENALTFFEEAILDDPSYSEALYNLACCYSMTKVEDKAYLYLSRAVNLNPHCIDWAKDDREFNNVRESDIFQNIISGEKSGPIVEDETPEEENEEISVAPEPEEEPIPEEEEEVSEILPESPPSEPPPNLDDGTTPSLASVEEEGLPPCPRCEGIVKSERCPRFNPKLALVIIISGIVFSVGLLVSYMGFLGIPIILFGLYCLSQIDTVWVCQNCGARGEDCGQPVSEPIATTPSS